MPQNKVLDFHTHLGKDKDGTELSIDQLLKSMEEAGITDSVVFPLNERDTTVEDASLQLAKLQLVKQSKGHSFYPFFRFDPKNMTPERLKELLNGFYGVKLHPRSQDFDPLDRRFFGLYEVISASGKPVLFHARYESVPDTPDQVNPNSNPGRISKLAEEFPDLALVIGHFGNLSGYVLEMMKKYPRIYLETSIAGSTPQLIEVIASRVGVERILFGSDIPYSDQLIERMKIDRSNLRPADKEKILYHNAAQLLRIG